MAEYNRKLENLLDVKNEIFESKQTTFERFDTSPQSTLSSKPAQPEPPDTCKQQMALYYAIKFGLPRDTLTGIFQLLLPTHLWPNSSPACCLISSPINGSQHFAMESWTLDDCVKFIEDKAKSHKGSISALNIDCVVINF
jgi:hypothetical protein